MIIVSGTDIKYFHEYSLKLRRAAEDEFAHQPWRLNLTLAESFTVTALLFTLTDRMPSRGVGNMWAWEYNLTGSPGVSQHVRWTKGKSANVSPEKRKVLLVKGFFLTVFTKI